MLPKIRVNGEWIQISSGWHCINDAQRSVSSAFNYRHRFTEVYEDRVILDTGFVHHLGNCRCNPVLDTDDTA